MKLTEKLNNILEVKATNNDADDFIKELIAKHDTPHLKEVLNAWKSLPKKSRLEKDLIKLLTIELKGK